MINKKCLCIKDFIFEITIQDEKVDICLFNSGCYYEYYTENFNNFQKYFCVKYNLYGISNNVIRFDLNKNKHNTEHNAVRSFFEYFDNRERLLKLKQLNKFIIKDL